MVKFGKGSGADVHPGRWAWGESPLRPMVVLLVSRAYVGSDMGRARGGEGMYLALLVLVTV